MLPQANYSFSRVAQGRGPIITPRARKSYLDSERRSFSTTPWIELIRRTSRGATYPSPCNSRLEARFCSYSRQTNVGVTPSRPILSKTVGFWSGEACSSGDLFPLRRVNVVLPVRSRTFHTNGSSISWWQPDSGTYWTPQPQWRRLAAVFDREMVAGQLRKAIRCSRHGTSGAWWRRTLSNGGFTASRPLRSMK